MKFALFLAVSVSALLMACSGSPFGKDNDTHSRGYKAMIADEAYQPLLRTVSMTFSGLYPEATINFSYRSETEALNALIADETKTIFVSRDFTEKEKTKLVKSNIQAKAIIFAYDAVTFILHPSVMDTVYSEEQIKQLLTSNSGKTTMVFDQVQSSNFNYLQRHFKIGKYGKNVKALSSTPDVIKYVSEHPDAIGIVGFAWLSDMEDPVVQARLKQVRVAYVSNPKDGKAYQPHSYNLRESLYPFRKEIYCLNKGAADGLNSGFTVFLEDEKGQLLIHKTGLLPYRKTPRMFNFEFE
jgi:phosphate transport system substrate-binding protein